MDGEGPNILIPNEMEEEEEPKPSTSAAAAAEMKKPESQSEKTFSRYSSLILTECGFKISTSEQYLKRLQNLRKELNYISETDWLYEPVDKRTLQ